MIENGFSPDTSIESLRIQFSILRNIGAEGRIKMAFELSDNLRSITESGIKFRHPEYDDEMVRLAWIRLTSGPKLFRKFFPNVRIEL